MVDAEDRIRIREVVVLRRERNRVLVTGGLEPGERVVVSPLEAPIDGMYVRTGRPALPAPAAPETGEGE